LASLAGAKRIDRSITNLPILFITKKLQHKGAWLLIITRKIYKCLLLFKIIFDLR